MKTAAISEQVQTPWDPEFAVFEADASMQGKNGAVKQVRVVKEAGEFYILLRFTWRQGEFYLATVRKPNEPRRFKDMTRLLEYIQEHYPSNKQFLTDIRD